MSAIWLACCNAADYRGVQREIAVRDEGAQLLRMSDLSEVRRMMRALPVGGASIALVDDGGEGARMSDVVSGLVADGHSREILVLTHLLDPARIAVLFASGATEVVAAEQAADDVSDCAGEDPGGVPASPDGVRDDSAPATNPLQSDVPGADPDPAPSAVTAASPSREAATAPWEGELEEPGPAPGAFVPDQPTSVLSVAAERAAEPAVAAGVFHARGSVPVADPGAAPVVAIVSGRGGTGKTTVLAGLACCAAQWGLRAAVIDADLMFGNAYERLGCEAAPDLAALAREDLPLGKAALARCALLVAPGLTIWGPCALPEEAELVGARMDELLTALRREADVVLVDTASPWGDAVAAAVAQSERCLITADLRAGMVPATKRVIALAAKLGVPRTKMVCVANRFEARSPVEEFALRLEMEAGLASKTRIAAASPESRELMRLGRMDEALKLSEPFSDDIRKFARLLLRELGCVIAPPADPVAVPREGARRKFRLPWKEADGR